MSKRSVWLVKYIDDSAEGWVEAAFASEEDAEQYVRWSHAHYVEEVPFFPAKESRPPADKSK